MSTLQQKRPDDRSWEVGSEEEGERKRYSRLRSSGQEILSLVGGTRNKGVT